MLLGLMIFFILKNSFCIELSDSLKKREEFKTIVVPPPGKERIAFERKISERKKLFECFFLLKEFHVKKRIAEEKTLEYSKIQNYINMGESFLNKYEKMEGSVIFDFQGSIRSEYINLINDFLSLFSKKNERFSTDFELIIGPIEDVLSKIKSISKSLSTVKEILETQETKSSTYHEFFEISNSSDERISKLKNNLKKAYVLIKINNKKVCDKVFKLSEFKTFLKSEGDEVICCYDLCGVAKKSFRNACHKNNVLIFTKILSNLEEERNVLTTIFEALNNIQEIFKHIENVIEEIMRSF